MNSKGIAKLPIVVAVLAIAVSALLGWVWYQANQDDSATEIVNGSNGEAEQEQRHPDGWVVYENIDFGLSFAHPEAWGDVEIEQDEGVTGSAFSASFSSYENVTLTGESVDYESIMGPSSILGAKGWVADDDLYYFIMNSQQVLAENAEVFEAWSGEGLYHVDSSPEAVFSANELHRASFNLGSSRYDGVVFMYRITDGQTLADGDDFRWMAESVEVF